MNIDYSKLDETEREIFAVKTDLRRTGLDDFISELVAIAQVGQQTRFNQAEAKEMNRRFEYDEVLNDEVVST